MAVKTSEDYYLSLAAKALNKDASKVTIAEKCYVMNAVIGVSGIYTYEQLLSKVKAILS